MGPASAYMAVLLTIDNQVDAIIRSNPDIFCFGKAVDGISAIRDFGTTGVVAFARGESFEDLIPGRHNISGRRVQVKDSYRRDAINAMNSLVSRF